MLTSTLQLIPQVSLLFSSRLSLSHATSFLWVAISRAIVHAHLPLSLYSAGHNYAIISCSVISSF